jgi:hypothetical protein
MKEREENFSSITINFSLIVEVNEMNLFSSLIIIILFEDLQVLMIAHGDAGFRTQNKLANIREGINSRMH